LSSSAAELKLEGVGELRSRSVVSYG